jgi:hypothetical protein
MWRGDVARLLPYVLLQIVMSREQESREQEKRSDNLKDGPSSSEDFFKINSEKNMNT